MSANPAPKPTITIDGKAIAFEPGDTIMKAAERGNIDKGIPRFCYHPGLPVAATCRMCTVEVEKAPKLMTACSTPATDGMIVHTQSEKARKSRAGVMEFLLINHPLDCPVCDQAGECSLQDYNYEYGPGTSEYKEEKRTYEKAATKKLSERLTLNMNRCIHCERCVRFTENVTKTGELLMNHRGWRKELTTGLEEGMFNEYQGNIADICPVGAITFNDFRFKKRVWFLKPEPTICDGCSKGCSVFADKEQNTIYRYRARENKAVNDHWICDPGRVSFHHFQDKSRIVEPMLMAQGSGQLTATNWQTAIPWFKGLMTEAKRVLFVFGTDSTNEEASLLMNAFGKLVRGVEFFYYNGTAGVQTSKDDQAIDQLLRRKDLTANTKGMEDLGLKPLAVNNTGSYDLAIYFRAGRSALLPQKYADTQIGWGVFYAGDLEKNQFTAVLPGLSFLEKKGSFTNCDGIVQNFAPVLTPFGVSASVEKVLAALNTKVARNENANEVAVGSV